MNTVELSSLGKAVGHLPIYPITSFKMYIGMAYDCDLHRCNTNISIKMTVVLGLLK